MGAFHSQQLPSYMGSSMSSAKSPRKIAIPLYLWPGYGSTPCAWERILATPAANPIVVVNPDSGPGEKAFKLFSDAVTKCQAVGIKVLGYIRTEYAKRDQSQVAHDLKRYKSWYNVDGFFVDEMYHWGETLLTRTHKSGAHNNFVSLRLVDCR